MWILKTDMIVDGKVANKILDIRVQSGRKIAENDLIQYGKDNGITVTIQEKISIITLCSCLVTTRTWGKFLKPI